MRALCVYRWSSSQTTQKKRNEDTLEAELRCNFFFSDDLCQECEHVRTAEMIAGVCLMVVFGLKTLIYLSIASDLIEFTIALTK